MRNCGSSGEAEGVTISAASEKDFWDFVKSLPAARKGSLVLMENGNLRAVWEASDDSHLALQFRGDRMIQYVIFKRRPRPGRSLEWPAPTLSTELSGRLTPLRCKRWCSGDWG